MARTLAIKVLNGQEECDIYSFYCLSVTQIEMRVRGITWSLVEGIYFIKLIRIKTYCPSP